MKKLKSINSLTAQSISAA